MAVTLAKSTVGQRTQLGIQTASGTGVAASRRMPTLSITPSPATDAHEYHAQGNKFTSVVVPNKEWSTWKGDGTPSYGEMPLLLTSLFAAASPVTSSGVTTWTMAPSDGVPDIPQLFTLEHGDPTDAIQTIDNVVTDLDIEFDRSQLKLTASGIGRAFTTPFTLTGVDPVYTLSLGAPSAGTFTLSFNGQTTAGIAYNATASAIQTALTGLSSVGSGNATVTGTGPFTITLQGALAGTVLPLTGSGTGLTGGTFSLTETSSGVSFYEDVPIQPGTVAVFLDTSYASIGTTKLTNVLSGKFSVTGRWGPEWIVDDAIASYYQLVEQMPKASLSLMLAADSNARAYFATYRAGTLVYLQLKATGPLISGGTHYSFTLNVPVEFSKLQEFKDEGGVYALGFELTPISDPTAGYAMQATVVNATATL